MSGGRGLGEMAVQAACALAEVFFPEDAAGETAVPLDQAHLIASGRLDLWDEWESQPPDMKALVGQFLRLRHNELASRNAFLAAAPVRDPGRAVYPPRGGPVIRGHPRTAPTRW